MRDSSWIRNWGDTAIDLYTKRSRLAVKVLDLFSRPWRTTQESQAGLNAGILGKTVDPDTTGHIFPTILLDQTGQDHLECDAVQRVFMFLSAEHSHTP